MKAFSTYTKERGEHRLIPALLWEYHLDNFDWQKYRCVVAERVVSMGHLFDWYAAFDLYGGISGFCKMACDEVAYLSPRDLKFMCGAFNIEKTETQCCK